MNTTQDGDLSPETSTTRQIDQVVIHLKTRRETHLVVCCVPQSNQETSQNTFAIMEGVQVVTSDGKPVGSVERLVAKPGKNGPRDYLIAKALLLKEKQLIPVEWIDSYGDGEVRLADDWNVRLGAPARK